jgi:hypothetical protein
MATPLSWSASADAPAVAATADAWAPSAAIRSELTQIQRKSDVQYMQISGNGALMLPPYRTETNNHVLV